jgi:hypothetical protein
MDFRPRISWSAVVAGVLIAAVTLLMLTLLGIGIGLGTIDPLEETDPTAGLGIGTAIWFIAINLICLFVGSWVAGRLASARRLFDGIIHGVLTWAVSTLLTIYLLTTSIGNLIGGAGHLLGGVMRTAGSFVSAAAPDIGKAVQDQLQEHGVSRADQQDRVKVDQTREQAEVKARHVADDVASAGSKAAILTFIQLLLEVTAAGFGAKLGTNFKDD